MLSKREYREVFRVAYKAAGLTFDEAKPPIVEPDSKFASKVLSALSASGQFDDGEMATLLDMLADAGMVTKMESQSMKEGFGPPPDEMASDAAYRTAVRSRRERLYSAGHISHSQLRSPISRPTSAASGRAFDERFPDAGRLRG